MSSDNSELTENLGNFSETDLQLGDQDKDLDTSLRSQGSSLEELYPSMISQIGRARHRQCVTDAADSVLRRYHRWRCLSNRSTLNSTFNVSQRHTKKTPEKTSRPTLEETCNSPWRRQLPGTTPNRGVPSSPLHKANTVQDCHTKLYSPGRGRASLRGARHQPVVVMDFSDPCEPPEPPVQLYETFTVTPPSPPSFYQLGEPYRLSAASPSRGYSPSVKASLDPSLRSRRLTHSSPSARSVGCAMFDYETTTDTYRSPVRQSPLKAKLMSREGVTKSPYAFSRSPKTESVGNNSREAAKARSLLTLLSSPPRKPTPDFLRMPCSQNFRYSPQSHLRSPLSRRQSIQRHRSFDSFLPTNRVPFSQKELDDDFTRLYHKFVCQSKSSPFRPPPCRHCMKSSEASRGHSSQTLVALALSPHRFALKKRHRELDRESYPQSKRSREGYCAHSPGSKHLRKESLRRCLCPPELDSSHVGSSGSSSSSVCRRFSRKQLEWPASAAECSGLGKPFKSVMNQFHQ